MKTQTSSKEIVLIMSKLPKLDIIAVGSGAEKTAMKKDEVKKDILEEKLLKGLDLAYERMITEKRKNNQKIVVRREGKIVTIIP